MTDQFFFVLLIVLAVLLPMIPSFILFKFLPNDASVAGPFKGMKTKFGGAFAGYLVLFLVLIGLIETTKSSTTYMPYEVWHIAGQAGLANGEQLLPTDITINPPNVNVSRGGSFYLDVPVGKKDGDILNFPTVSVSHQGFDSVDIPLDGITAPILRGLPIKVEKDRVSRTIVIQKFDLDLSKPYNQGGAR